MLRPGQASRCYMFAMSRSGIAVIVLAIFLGGCTSGSAGGTRCPVHPPETGNSCPSAGMECGYSGQPNACGASNCYCQGGLWNCEPTCIIDASVSAEAALDLGDGGPGALICYGGCLCFAGDACPVGCYPSRIEQPDGSASEFCSSGIVTCAPGGVAWSVGMPTDKCGAGTPTYVDGGPDGAFCCLGGAGSAGEGGDASAE